MAVKGGKAEVVDERRSKMNEAEEALEERKLGEMLIPKKKQRLYKKIMIKKKKTAREVSYLRRSRCILITSIMSISSFLRALLIFRRKFCKRSGRRSTWPKSDATRSDSEPSVARILKSVWADVSGQF